MWYTVVIYIDNIIVVGMKGGNGDKVWKRNISYIVFCYMYYFGGILYGLIWHDIWRIILYGLLA